MASEPDLYDLNPNRLDEEWLAQPRLYHDAAVELAEASEELELAQAAKDVTHAELSTKIRQHPDNCGVAGKDGKAPTEDAIESAIIIHVDHRKAVRAVIEAKKKVKLAQALVTRLDHRKKALEKLVDLRLSDYYSDPKVSRAASREIDRRKSAKAFRPIPVDNRNEE